MRTDKFLTLTVLAFCLLWAGCVGIHSTELASDIFEEAGVERGMVVHVGCGKGRLTASLSASDLYTVHGLDTGTKNVRRAREYLQAQGLEDKVSVERLMGRKLPYVDNLVNLVVVQDPFAVEMGEVMRVLAPGGAAVVISGFGYDISGFGDVIRSSGTVDIDPFREWITIRKPGTEDGGE